MTLACLVRQQSRTAQPLLERSLFANRGFVAGLAFGASFFATVTGTMYVTALYLQEQLQLSPLHAALTAAPMSVGIIAASFTVRRHVTTRGRTVVSAGVALFGAGVAAMAVLIAVRPDPVPWIGAPLFVAGLGMGCCFGAVFAVALGDVAEAQAGSASGVRPAGPQRRLGQFRIGVNNRGPRSVPPHDIGRRPRPHPPPAVVRRTAGRGARAAEAAAPPHT